MVSVVVIGVFMIFALVRVVVILGGMIRFAIPIVIVGFAFVFVIFSCVVGGAIAVMVVIDLTLSLGGVVVIFRCMVGRAVAIMIVTGFAFCRGIVIRRLLRGMVMIVGPILGRVVFRGVVGLAVAVVVVRNRRFLLRSEHHLADFQHRLGAVRLLLQQQGGAVLGDDGGVEAGLATAADA
jgi:hypothetical protein